MKRKASQKKVQTKVITINELSQEERERFQEDTYDNYDLVVDPEEQLNEIVHSNEHEDRLKSHARPSLLSDDNVEHIKYDGFFNLAIMMLIVSHFRIIMENLAKYGLLLNLPHYAKVYFEESKTWPALITVCTYNIWILVTLYIEKYISNKSNQELEWSVYLLHFSILSFFIYFTVYVIYNFGVHPFSGINLMTALIILVMKLYSYTNVNRQLRETHHSKYPQNLTIIDMYYFLAAPTLVYEPDFPRSEKIRWGYLFKLILSFIFFALLMDFMIEQYIFPITQMSMKQNDMFGVFTKILQLTIPNIALWLLMFVTVFHVWLNILAEVLRFGDRLFYLDWWNCTSMDFFWRTWNLPVHKWMVAHVYLPLTHRGWSTSVASFMVFFISAIGHEVIISIPFHTMKTWAFTAMMAQMPLCYWTRAYTKGHVAGNILFWASFMFGQSNCILMYYKDFEQKNL